MLGRDAYREIALELRENGVLIATLNRPEQRNAVGHRMAHELATLPRDVNASPDVKVLVLTGAGESFCAGGDFGRDVNDLGEVPGYLNTMYPSRITVDNWLDCEKPVISAVNGHAFGLGATLALLADVVFAVRGAVFCDSHVKMGLSAGDGGTLLWPLLMGPSRAKYYLMTGRRLPAEEAERLGLVQFVVGADELMSRVLELADELAAGPLRAISASKMPVNQWMKFVSNVVLPAALSMEEVCLHTEDFKEAVAAFQEKRKPRFQGR
jgi:enoyl-CoA hydratase